MLTKTLALAAALAVVSVPAFADGIAVSGAFARETPPSAKAGGAFMTFENTGPEDRLIAASSPVAARVELHTHTMTDGIMKMREIEGGIPMPSGETVTLKPGGMHVMLMGLKEPLKRDTTIAITLDFESADDMTIEVPVRTIGAMHSGTHSHN